MQKHRDYEKRALRFLPLETRDDNDPPNDDLTAARQAVEELRTAVETHRTTTDERLTNELRSLTERLDGLETRIQRPGPSQNQPTEDQRQLQEFIRHGTGQLVEQRASIQQIECRALRMADDPAGGYLAVPDFLTEMIRLLTEVSPVRAAARVGSTAMASVILPKRTGITNATWEGETEESTESEPAFGQVEIPVDGLKTHTDISVQLLEDAAVDVESELNMALTEDMAQKEGTAFVSGDGVKKPRGFMTHPDVVARLNGHATVLQMDGIIDLFHRVPQFYRNNGVWMMNSLTIGEVRKLKDASGDYLWREALAEGNPATILGRPVIDTPDMDDVGSGNHPIAFGDFGSAYRIYDRVVMTLLRDPFTQATKGLVRFHARRRVGADVVNSEAIAKLLMST